MNILVDICHPAHVHFFKNPIKIWREAGHQVTIVTRDKEITHKLLDELNLEYIPLSKQKTSFLGMLWELLIRWVKMFFLIRKNKIEVAISIAGIFTSLPAKLNGIAAITCTDTEDAVLSNKIAFKFSDIVLVPTTFLKQNEFKNIKTYPAFHELAYLHPNWFKPQQSNLKYFKVTDKDKYVLIRLVKWKALHDINEAGITEQDLKKITAMLQKNGYKYLISSEREISKEYNQYLIKGNLSKIFDLMAFAYGFIGESPTMAVETAFLGKPSVLINTRVNQLGNMIELQNKYGILFNFEKTAAALKFVQDKFFSAELREKVTVGYQALLRDKIDISTWLAKFTVEFTREYFQRKSKK